MIFLKLWYFEFLGVFLFLTHILYPVECFMHCLYVGEQATSQLCHVLCAWKNYFCAVKLQLLHHQSFSTGLFRNCCNSARESAITPGEVGHVRESIYCAIASWALGQAYRHVDCDGGRTHELEHSAVKCMRGILYCWMRQHKEVIAVLSNVYNLPQLKLFAAKYLV